MDPPAIIVALDIREQVASRLLVGWPSLLVGTLDLERVENALHRRIIVAADRPAHRWFGFHRNELLAVCLGGVLAAAVGMAISVAGLKIVLDEAEPPVMQRLTVPLTVLVDRLEPALPGKRSG